MTRARPGCPLLETVPGQPLPTSTFVTSHALGVCEAVDLARSLGTLPSRVVVIGIEVDRLDAGGGLTPSVSDAVDDLVRVLDRA